jgi:hypothetical protein
MARIHALEWEDLQWFPRAWRDYGTNYLQFFATKLDAYKAAAPIVEKGLAASGGSEWVDLASGGGGALLRLSERLKDKHPDLRITMSDYYPNVEAFERTVKVGGEKVFSYEKESVDARKVPSHLRGKFRTLFGAFHHFRPADAQAILQDAVDSRTPIAIFEPVGRNFMSWFSMLFVPLNVFLLTPFIRPFDWRVLPFIYLIPLIPAYVQWDGIASILRTYSEKERREMIAKLRDSDSFEWEVGSKKEGPMAIHYLLGVPKK